MSQEEAESHGEKRPPLKKYGSNDSLDVESARVGHHQNPNTVAIGSVALLQLAFQSIGIVYGDIGTSPLYVFAGIFSNGISHEDDLFGVLSLIFYTLTIIPVVKYVFIVLRANDNGNGGTFALYSLICRYAKVGLLPNQEKEDQNVSRFQLDLPSDSEERASKVRAKLESSHFFKYFLLFATMLGTAMLIGDGVLTPCISVLSAVGGLKLAIPTMSNDALVWIAVVILIMLFSIQRFGTDKVGYTFAPVLSLWFFMIFGIGLYNFFRHDPRVIKALNPMYIFSYFGRNKVDAWISLGGVVLSITGTEALFADVGHFSVKSIQISTCSLVYPSIVLAYFGQASYLRKHMDDVAQAFYASIPGPLYWPMFVLAVMASVIASQSLISGTFSIVQQSLALGCFPRVKVVHTSTKYPGQVYIPEMNYVLMLACVFVTLGFRDTVKMGNAYGLAVVFVMVLTSAFLILVMVLIWKTPIYLIFAYLLTIGAIELAYLSSVLYKFDQGGYLPLVFAAFLMAIMYVWNEVYRRRYYYELEHKISPENVKEIIEDTNSRRIPGLAIFYSELVHGIPPIFKRYVENVPVLHSVLIFVSFKSLPINTVPIDERFLFRRVQPRELQVFRCVIRFGYKDVKIEEESFERTLVERLKEFIREDYMMCLDHAAQEGNQSASSEDEIRRDEDEVEKAWRCGVVHLVGEQEVVAAPGSNVAKRVLINQAFNFIKNNVRQANRVFEIPQKRMLKVGMTYEL